MDSASRAESCQGLQELVSHAWGEGLEIANALSFLAQTADDMNHNDRQWRVGALILFLCALEKQARALGDYMDKEGTTRSPKPTAEGSTLHEKQVAASQVWGDGMRVIYQHPELAGEVADALKEIAAKVPADKLEARHV